MRITGTLEAKKTPKGKKGFTKMIGKYTELKTVRRACQVCKKKTEQERQKGWYLCLECLRNADTNLDLGEKKWKAQKEQLLIF